MHKYLILLKSRKRVPWSGEAIFHRQDHPFAKQSNLVWILYLSWNFYKMNNSQEEGKTNTSKWSFTKCKKKLKRKTQKKIMLLKNIFKKYQPTSQKKLLFFSTSSSRWKKIGDVFIIRKYYEFRIFPAPHTARMQRSGFIVFVVSAALLYVVVSAIQADRVQLETFTDVSSIVLPAKKCFLCFV